ncbi:hypothetical protein BN1723_016382 [Verticillium longisporum]|uniref:Uncharacterized protein n=1 Tax=Verticillium longisporum TaxID=100787 RepID=A0A0G4NEG9_VERLO|nr:hypothetical protein BN1723_016382 [Verticillium longisporum]
MVPKETVRHRKAVRRNIGSLLTKCEDYSNLGNIEVALYVFFPDDGGLYHTSRPTCIGVRTSKPSTQPTLHLPENLKKCIGQKVTGFYFKQKRGRLPGVNKTGMAGKSDMTGKADMTSKTGTAVGHQTGVPTRWTRSLARAGPANRRQTGRRVGCAFPAMPDLRIGSLQPRGTIVCAS